MNFLKINMDAAFSFSWVLLPTPDLWVEGIEMLKPLVFHYFSNL
jgi:hypothetical protein